MITRLVFEGGGMKGIAYTGALSVLEENGLLDNVKGYAGTSAGAVMACFCAIGMNSARIESILRTTDFTKFKDDDFWVLRDTNRLLTKFGWYRGDFITSWIAEIVRENFVVPDPSFKDLYEETGNDLRLIGSNLSTGYSEVFSYRTTPDMSIVLGVRISGSLPLFFTAIRYNGCLYVDGGLFRNYPIRVFDSDVPKEETVGFRLDSTSEVQTFESFGKEFSRKEVVNFEDYAEALLSSLLSVQEDRHLRSDDWKRTIYVDTAHIRTTQFEMSRDDLEFLIAQGRKGGVKFVRRMAKQ